MELVFSDGTNLASVKIIGKTVLISTELTNNKFIDVRQVFKKKQPEMLKEFNCKIEEMKDKEVIEYVKDEFKKMGYSLIKTLNGQVG